MPGGVFPGEGWLRKRGKYAERPGDAYNSLSIYVTRLLGGVRKVRQLLGHPEASTTKWTAKSTIKAWRGFQTEYGLSPTQMFSLHRRKTAPREIVKLAQNIRQAAITHGVLNEARNGKKSYRIIWTKESTIAAWRAFEKQHGFAPSFLRRSSFPRELYNEAARIYNPARKLGLLAIIRG